MADEHASPNITSMLNEHRVFEPPTAFREAANVSGLAAYEALYARSIANPEKFWAEIAATFEWSTPWSSVLEWNHPFAKWFVGGRTNLSVNCLDRHVKTARRNKAAIVWEGEPGDERILTYQTLHRETCRFANVLKSLGVIETRMNERNVLHWFVSPKGRQMLGDILSGQEEH